MKTTLLEYLRCPLCRHALVIVEPSPATELITEGTLRCSHCQQAFTVHAGIPNMFAPQLPHAAEKQRESQGWLALAQADGWYEPDPVIDLALPDVVGKLGWDLATGSNWLGTYHSFTHLLEHYVQPGQKVLEIGAAKTWAGAQFVQRGCRYTGFDMVVDPNIGLGRSQFYQHHHRVEYEVVAGDAEFLPFADDTFDLVFAVATLHHALDLPQMVAELARVTRRGGIVAGLNEGVRAFWASPEAEGQAKEKTYGINEHSYTLGNYYKAFRRAGLHIRQVTHSARYRLFLPPKWQSVLQTLERLPFSRGRLAISLLVNGLHPYEGLTIYGRK